MEAEIVNLQTLFGKQVSYRIPQFQRPYAWKKGEQWVPLWDDVRNFAERCLHRQQNAKLRPHFMGAIVLQRQNNASSEVEKRIVVDGQQRLTTLQLLIRSAQEVFASLDDSKRESRLRRLTSNEKIYWARDSNNETKIRQTDDSDNQRDFQRVIRTGKEGEMDDGIRGAYKYFVGEIADWMDEDLTDRENRSNALEETLTKHFQTAAIDLDEDEEPHIIFETLNARGEPLKQSDLIKNTVMFEAKVIDDYVKAKKLWGMFENAWWRALTKEKNVKRIHLDRFLNYWMVVLTQREVAVNRVAASFREYVNPKNMDCKCSIEEVVAGVKKAGGIYSHMEATIYPGIETFLKRIKTMDVGVTMLLLLRLYTAEVPEERRMRFVQALESYLVRRMLCGLGPNSLGKFFIEILREMETNNADTILIENFRRQTADGRLWPSDHMMLEELGENSMHYKGARQKMVMEAIEMHMRSDMAEPLIATSQLTVEHILPQKWEKNWPLPSTVVDREEATEDRNKAVKAIGNLTLTSGKLNARLSNGPWKEKKETLGKHSVLFLNRNLLENPPAVWDEDAIWKRSRQLAELVIEIWPGPDKF